MKDFVGQIVFLTVIVTFMAFFSYPVLFALTAGLDWIADEPLYGIPWNPRLAAASGLAWMFGSWAANR